MLCCGFLIDMSIVKHQTSHVIELVTNENRFSLQTMYYTSITTWFLFGLAASAQALLKAGDFQNYAHGISGEVYIKDEQHLVIKGFSYDGAGPDAFFWAGNKGAPSTVGTMLDL